MESGSTRVMAALGCLAVVWIATYWLYEPGGRDSQGLAPLPQMGDTPLPAARSGLPAAPRAGEQGPPSRPLPQPEVAKPEPTPAAPVAQPTPAPAPAPAATGVIPPQFDDYTVKAGETFETIAKAKYGSSKLSTVIMHANPMKDPKRLRPGDVVRLPRDPNNIQGKPAAAGSGSGGAGSGSGASPAAAMAEYVVQEGDTLSGIAKAVWGSSKEWRRILEANRGVLPSEDKIRVGMKLRIPPRPAD